MRITFATLLTLFVMMTPALAADDGATVFEDACASCHSGGFAGWWREAPDINDKEAWQPLLVKGAEALTLATINGIGEMPARGRCDTCTDEQIRAAVDYIMQEAQ
jgi:cytochrome c5